MHGCTLSGTLHWGALRVWRGLLGGDIFLVGYFRVCPAVFSQFFLVPSFFAIFLFLSYPTRVRFLLGLWWFYFTPCFLPSSVIPRAPSLLGSLAGIRSAILCFVSFLSLLWLLPFCFEASFSFCPLLRGRSSSAPRVRSLLFHAFPVFFSSVVFSDPVSMMGRSSLPPFSRAFVYSLLPSFVD